MAQLFETLTTFDASLELRPALAESWRVEEEGLRVVFRLRPDLTFSDGSPLRASDVVRSWFRVIDPEAPEAATLEAAVRLARLLALASLAERDVTVDAGAIETALVAIRQQLDLVRGLKAQLTSISTATKNVWTGLDEMRTAILARVSDAEAEIRTAAD